MPDPQLLGPLGLTFGLIIAVGVLWRLATQYIADLRRRDERWQAKSDQDESKLAEQTKALSIIPKIAEAIERIERKVETLR